MAGSRQKRNAWARPNECGQNLKRFADHKMISSSMLALLILCISLIALQTEAWSATPLTSSSRSDFVRRFLIDAPSAMIFLVSNEASKSPAHAAPPFAIMEEEMGYFPVIDERSGETVMVPAKAKRESTDQAVALAKYLQSTGAIMYGAFWCPHCSRQKELFGKEAWKYISYVECSPKGYRTKYATCLEKGVDGYPSWKFGNGKSQGGEMELMDIVKMSGYKKAFNADLETGVPPLGGGSCQN